MLSIDKLDADADPAAYYLEALARGAEDYYLTADEAPGRWVGQGSSLLGLAGQVEPDDLRAVLRGDDPRTGQHLGTERTVAGFDLTLSAPKSVSVLWGLGDRRVAAAVVAAHAKRSTPPSPTWRTPPASSVGAVEARPGWPDRASSVPPSAIEAVVIGEPQRAFYGNQFGLTFPEFVHYGVDLWVPEVGGAVDPGSEAHDLVMSLYGGMSKGERTRIRTRVRSAMATQASVEGRFLGGRPPYGYRLADAGPHPNPGKAADGKRLHRLEPDPVAAPAVVRIFDEFLSGRGLFAIADRLTRDDVLSPSAHDPERNRHRAGSGGVWSKGAVRNILLNPRYTGFQVWNRQRRDEVLIDVEDVALGHETRMRWNAEAQWVRSEQPTHEAIIDIERFEAARKRFERYERPPTRRRSRRPYLLSGLLHCGRCGRRMQGSWNHDQAYYRCKFPAEYAVPRRPAPEDGVPAGGCGRARARPVGGAVVRRGAPGRDVRRPR